MLYEGHVWNGGTYFNSCYMQQHFCSGPALKRLQRLKKHVLLTWSLQWDCTERASASSLSAIIGYHLHWGNTGLLMSWAVCIHRPRFAWKTDMWTYRSTGVKGGPRLAFISTNEFSWVAGKQNAGCSFIAFGIQRIHTDCFQWASI